MAKISGRHDRDRSGEWEETRSEKSRKKQERDSNAVSSARGGRGRASKAPLRFSLVFTFSLKKNNFFSYVILFTNFHLISTIPLQMKKQITYETRTSSCPLFIFFYSISCFNSCFYLAMMISLSVTGFECHLLSHAFSHLQSSTHTFNGVVCVHCGSHRDHRLVTREFPVQILGFPTRMKVLCPPAAQRLL